MPTNTYVALRTETVATATSSVTLSLSGISGYTDLVLVINATASGGALNPQIQFNGDTASNYSLTWMYGNGSSPFSGRYSNQTSSYIGYLTTTEPATFIVQVQNYSNSTTNKTALFRWNTTNTEVGAGVCLWRNTAAITSVTIKTSANNFAVGSTFSLYGITTQATPGTAKATGGTITYDQSGNVIHTFTSSGTFTPTANISNVDYLVVAGGGGGAWFYGGGGAGGVRSTVTATGGGGSLETPLSLLNGTNYTVTVGAGGAGAVGGRNQASGNDSVFSTITSIGGGKGGTGDTGDTPAIGGSGGGNGGWGNTARTGAAGTANQGYNGGDSSTEGGGGGGGANAAGGTGTNSNGGVGGAGVSVAIAGSNVTYAGGGGAGTASGAGGAGGTGGGGSSPAGSGSGTAGTANTGSGGAAPNRGYTSNSGGAGGSGIVIIRYSGV